MRLLQKANPFLNTDDFKSEHVEMQLKIDVLSVYNKL